MKTFKSASLSFKDYCRPGARCVFTAPAWCIVPTIRKIVTVQSRKVSFTHPTRDSESWLDFPKSTEIKEVCPGKFIIIHADDPDGKNALTYDFRLEAFSVPGIVEPDNSK